jgi:hypothetical protein
MRQWIITWSSWSDIEIKIIWTVLGFHKTMILALLATSTLERSF